MGLNLDCIALEYSIMDLTLNKDICPGGLAWAVVRYLDRPLLRRNTMPVKNTACASLR